MTGKTHVAIGVAAALTISSGQPLGNQLGMVLTAMISSLIPDLDHPKSKLNQKILFINNNLYRKLFYISLGSLFIYLYFLREMKLFLLLGIISFLIGISNHRGFTHSILGFLASSSIVALGTLDYGLIHIYYGFILGYILHIVADFFTSKGVKLFYPLDNSISFPIKIKTNGKLEKVLFVVLSIYSVFYCLGILFEN